MKVKKTKYLYIPILLLFTIWIIKLIEFTFDINFVSLGIYPRKLNSISGIITSPLIHADFNHLLANSLPLFFLSASIMYFYKNIAIRIIIYSWLLTGFAVWLGGRYAYHIGASGLIYAFISFLFFSGILSKDKKLISISLLTVFLYGGLVWGILPTTGNISWESHLFGFVCGIILTYYFTPEIKKRKQIPKNIIIEDFSEINKTVENIEINYFYKDDNK
ncbi:MAG: rhomboid family intramembrane serine protease [Bacteroidales bacterium]|nr:rhomboid family intramembrane serine protease [Bacteroidales bacterium]MBN2756670.1 rhomboid family intramembrane serine protease [Bacteroidales bacterium]